MRPGPGPGTRLFRTSHRCQSVGEYLENTSTDFAAWLRINVCLHTVRWFQPPRPWGDYADSQTLPDCKIAEDEGRTSCRIFSIKHGEAEILHGRQYLQDVELSLPEDPNLTQGREDGGKRTGLSCIPYCHERPQESRDWLDLHGHGIPISRYRTHYPPTWRNFADLNGRHVPRDIIERMRKSEGLSLTEWEKRGVRVSEATWDILRGYLAEEMESLARVYRVVDKARE
jgi:hypothetical protein